MDHLSFFIFLFGSFFLPSATALGDSYFILTSFVLFLLSV